MEAYVDDILFKSRKAEDHTKDLSEVFVMLRKYKMMLNPKKCVFEISIGKFLGFIVS